MPKKQEAAPVVTAFKGFNADLTCRGFQYEIGKTYKMDGEPERCERGFHACENPFDVWGYYGPVSDGVTRYALVELSGAVDRDADDSKIAACEITIKSELRLPEFIQRGVEYILSKIDWDNAKEANTGDRSAATNTGYRSAATVEGKDSAAMASGYEGRASGAEGCALFLVERDGEMKIIAAWAGIVGRDGIKPDTFYMLKDGKPVEA